MNTTKILELFGCGAITEQETLNKLIDHATTVDLDSLPQEWYNKLKAHVDSKPTTDEGWERMRTFYMTGWVGPGSPPSQEELRVKSKAGTEFLRKEFTMRK